MKLKPVLKWTGIGLGLLVLLAVAAAGGLWWCLRASLAVLDGEGSLLGVSGPVTVERDALGVPTVRAANHLDATRALGFLHAQERFFQMDLMRRLAAGELGELFGPALQAQDGQVRLHRFRARARKVSDALPAADRALLEAYTAGVNAGLAALGTRPPEYLLLRAKPKPWRLEDSNLAGYAILLDLHDTTGAGDRHYAVLREALPRVAADFFGPGTRHWDAPLDGSVLPAPRVPRPEEFTLASLTNRAKTATASPAGEAALKVASQSGASARADRFAPAEAAEAPESERPLGSNNWAVDGRVSATGGAIVCNDMHLGIHVPNTWFRVRLRYHDPAVGEQDLVGVTLPGTPVLVVGSNRHIAGAFTYSCMDTSDLVRLELEPGHPRRYRTPAGWREFERIEEILQARGGTNLTLTIEETIWGPVIAVPGLPGKYALACTAHDPQALNLRLFDLARARDAETALRLAPVTGVPVNNFLVGDGQGNIGYTLIGRLPERFGFDGVAPVSWADGTCGWRGLLPPERYPRVLNPPDGCLWTANNRVLGTPEYLAGHPEEYDPGARAALIRNDLRALRGAVETNLWAIYLNDRALFLERWQQLLLSVLDRGSKTNTRWRELRDYVANWGGRAAAESQGYRFVRAFRHQTHELLFAPLNQRLGVRVGNEDAAWTLLTERPQHLLNPQFARFDDLLAEAVQRVLADLQTQNLPLAQATWGQRNVLRMQHPLSRAVPFLARWLDLPVVPMPGDDHMPRVYVSEWRGGVSERLVVSPGREEQGLFNMPGGQSGHFLSPFYQAGHAAWLKGEPLPLLPGPARHTLILRPVRGT